MQQWFHNSIGICRSNGTGQRRRALFQDRKEYATLNAGLGLPPEICRPVFFGRRLPRREATPAFPKSRRPMDKTRQAFHGLALKATMPTAKAYKSKPDGTQKIQTASYLEPNLISAKLERDMPLPDERVWPIVLAPDSDGIEYEEPTRAVEEFHEQTEWYPTCPSVCEAAQTDDTSRQ